MREQNKGNQGILWKTLLTALLVITPALLLTACSGSGGPSATVSEDGDLIIPIAGITEDASFYPVEADGTEMEIIAVRAPDGTIRTAFNTCQICYNSGQGYYKQSGDKLICQNCKNQFEMSRVQVEAGGCNPWPIFDENKIVTEESVTIPYAFLAESKEIFENWK